MKRLWRGWTRDCWRGIYGPTRATILPAAAAVLAGCAGIVMPPHALAVEETLQVERGQPSGIQSSRDEGAALGVTLAEQPDGTVQVSGVMPNSPAAEAGIRPGDRILAINDQLVSNSRDVTYLVSSQAPGKKITIRIDRAGLQGALRATLLSRHEVNQRAALGITLSRGTMGSVRVLAVVPNSPAAKAGIKMGDRLTAVNDEPVTSYDDAMRLIADDHPGDQLRLRVDRYGLQGTLLATIEAGQQVFQAPRPFVLPPAPPPPTEDDLLFRDTPAQIDDQRGYGD